MAGDSSHTFQIELNGEPHRIAGDRRLLALLAALELSRGRVAVEINRTVVPKADWGDITLHPGDVVEIVNFVGGG